MPTSRPASHAIVKMASILGVPRELRDMIWDHALYARQDPPASPAELRTGDRFTRCRRVCGSWFRGTRVRFEKLPASPSASLRLVNPQFYTEVTEAMERESKRLPDYHLDLMYLSDGSFWPTWTGIPVRTEHVGTIHATVRILHCPAELVTPEEHCSSPFFKGGGGPAGIVWVFYHMLRMFLEYGPRPRQCDGEEGEGEESNHGPGMKIRKLVINVLSATEPGIVHTAYPPSFSLINRLLWCDPLRCVDRGGRSLAPPGADEGPLAATLLARFLETGLELLLDVDRNIFSYGCIFYERVGGIEVRADGRSRTRTDLATLLAQAPFREGFGPYALEAWRRSNARWIVEATRQRREAGLSLEPPGAMQRRLLGETGRLEECLEMFAGEEAEAGEAGAD